MPRLGISDLVLLLISAAIVIGLVARQDEMKAWLRAVHDTAISSETPSRKSSP